MESKNKINKLKDDFDYLCNKINWKQSALDAKSVKIMNEFKSELDELCTYDDLEEARAEGYERGIEESDND